MPHRASTYRRRLFNFLAILSLLCCLATVALWVRSYWRADAYWQRKPGEMADQYFGIRVMPGRVVFFSLRSPPDPSNQLKDWARHPPVQLPSYAYWADKDRPFDSRWLKRSRFLGFGFSRYDNTRDYASSGVEVVTLSNVWFPHWFPALLFAILPTIRLVKILRTRRRHRAGLCPTCGYDLRATPERCPECGHVPDRVGTAA